MMKIDANMIKSKNNNGSEQGKHDGNYWRTAISLWYSFSDLTHWPNQENQ